MKKTNCNTNYKE